MVRFLLLCGIFGGGAAIYLPPSRVGTKACPPYTNATHGREQTAIFLSVSPHTAARQVHVVGG